MELLFKNRMDAGKKLARLLLRYPRQESVILTPLNESIILGRIAAALLGMPRDILSISPIAHPFYWDETIGAISTDDLFISTADHIAYLTGIIPLVRKRLMARILYLKRGRVDQILKNKTVIIMTDGCRTGEKLVPTIQLISRHRPREIVVAAPVMSTEAVARLKAAGATLHSLFTPMPYEATGVFYQDFRIYGDDELEVIFRGLAEP